ncbi:MAG: hypothetical protein PSV16_13965 [Flavobacterium sp.]|nr:hypothetical protein [Flavobacterium sp.]
MKKLLSLLFLITLSAQAQKKPLVLEFGFYLNQTIVSNRSVKCSIIIENDTIDCPIKSDKIYLPQIDSKGTLFFKFKKKIYKIEEVDFSKVHENMVMLIGSEKNTENFKLLSSDFPDRYRIDRTLIGVKIENLELAKEVWFVCFNAVYPEGDKKITVGSYSKSTIVK